ncbi:MAG: alpha/beta fold hydrolase [Selenomonadaceae bacterium]|nr:alpha/beta fold hydrolase [Selenomonadaceae bacterium]MBQ3726344.1 alpha/beta fold hydrolase [Selenomonadaceae bacterium]
MLIEGGNPFFMGGGSSGVLLVHGFTGLPAELFLLGEFLNRQNFTVLCPRLAGHGTDENDLMRTTKDDWFNSVLDGFHILRGVCEKIFVVGHSMGGLLTLKLAAEKNLAKIVTLAAPIFIDDGLGLKNLPPKEFCGNACIVQPRRKLNDVPQAANEVYKKTPLVSVHELVGLIDDAKNFLPKVTAPILIMHGEDDHTAQPRSARFIMDNVGSPDKKIITVPNSGHLLPLDENRDFVFESVLNFLRS